MIKLNRIVSTLVLLIITLMKLGKGKRLWWEVPFFVLYKYIKCTIFML